MARPERCEWVSRGSALEAFARANRPTTSSGHIRSLHWYVACRLCLEGGLHPDQITPRPPFVVSGPPSAKRVAFCPETGGSGEATILGGLKTKQVDVVVTVDGIGPVIAVSMKGTLNAVRNLTNRMEEAVGDCTNLHLTYPSLVYAFWHVVRGNRPGKLPANAPEALRKRASGDKTPPDECRPNDVALDPDGAPARALQRYHHALLGLDGRYGTRNHITRYEAVALTLVNVDTDDTVGEVIDTFPSPDSPVRCDSLFDRIYRQYDLRFVYQAPDLASRTRRHVWSEDSPAIDQWDHPEYRPRVGDLEDDAE